MMIKNIYGGRYNILAKLNTLIDDIYSTLECISNGEDLNIPEDLYIKTKPIETKEYMTPDIKQPTSTSNKNTKSINQSPILMTNP